MPRNRSRCRRVVSRCSAAAKALGSALAISRRRCSRWSAGLSVAAGPAGLAGAAGSFQGSQPFLQAGKAACELVQVQIAAARCAGSGRGPSRRPRRCGARARACSGPVVALAASGSLSVWPAASGFGSGGLRPFV